MELFPAIDLKEGQAVRLYQGDYQQMTVYDKDPLAVAHRFQQAGAKNLHVVDLDGAKDGQPANFSVIQDLVTASGLLIEVGGGIRDEARLKTYLELGVNRVILGTAAIRDFGFVQRMAATYGSRIAVGVDAKDGFVAVSGWQEVTDVPALEFCIRLRDAGVQTVIYTDIAKDGGLTGTNLEVYRQLSAIEGLDIIASGGISFAAEITELKKIGVYGAIVGKAIYTGTLDLAEILQLAK